MTYWDAMGQVIAGAGPGLLVFLAIVGMVIGFVGVVFGAVSAYACFDGLEVGWGFAWVGLTILWVFGYGLAYFSYAVWLDAYLLTL